MKLFAIAAVFGMGLVSCNTFIGMGRDVRQFGQGMEHVAHGRKPDGSEKKRNQSQEPQPSNPDENLPTY